MTERIEDPQLHSKKELLAKLIYEVGRVADALEDLTDNPTGDEQDE